MSVSSPRRSPRHQKRQNASEDQVLDMREVFNTFDINKTGYIEPFELKVALRAMGFNVTKADVREIIANLRGVSVEAIEQGEDMIRSSNENNSQNNDTYVDVAINFEEFKDIVEIQLGNKNEEDEIKRAFDLLDVKHRGKIGLEELKVVMKILNEENKMSDVALKKMIKMFDKDGDGEINFDEYRAIIMSTNE
ncbi:hypothetical protein M9Y10_005141 [Tritrichomonas musculus]|uniref:EF-hand domain-containing protein n=1 Tax=Tritrichomonas musculus TaxID=1915356 RepID=A0ABR2JLE2_9EUKA